MLQPVLASLLLVVVAPEIAPAAAGSAALATAQDPIGEYRKRRAGARGDVTKLHELKALKKAIDGLEKALSKKERELRSFAGL